MMINLKVKATGETLGSITEEDLKFLIDNLEEEWEEDMDYYLNRTTLEMLKERGCPEVLAALIEKAMGDRGEVEVEWSRV